MTYKITCGSNNFLGVGISGFRWYRGWSATILLPFLYLTLNAYRDDDLEDLK